jgi:hypothetical protein
MKGRGGEEPLLPIGQCTEYLGTTRLVGGADSDWINAYVAPN